MVWVVVLLAMTRKKKRRNSQTLVLLSPLLLLLLLLHSKPQNTHRAPEPWRGERPGGKARVILKLVLLLLPLVGQPHLSVS